jgi:hypothetical protein
MASVLRSLALFAALTLAVPAFASDPAPPAAAPAATGPAATTGAAAATSPATEPMVGEVMVLPYNRAAAYGVSRVRGPGVNLTDAGDGTWKGDIRGLNGVFTVTEKRISGANFNMVIDRDGDEVTFQGTVDGKRVRIVMTKETFVARYETRQYELKRVEPDLWATIPTGAALRVKGDAAGENPYFPQFLFALLAVL